jgi:hypothetical protein
MGIEPTLCAWEAQVLPLNYTRVVRNLFPGIPACALAILQPPDRPSLAGRSQLAELRSPPAMPDAVHPLNYTRVVRNLFPGIPACALAILQPPARLISSSRIHQLCGGQILPLPCSNTNSGHPIRNSDLPGRRMPSQYQQICSHTCEIAYRYKPAVSQPRTDRLGLCYRHPPARQVVHIVSHAWRCVKRTLHTAFQYQDSWLLPAQKNGSQIRDPSSS